MRLSKKYQLPFNIKLVLLFLLTLLILCILYFGGKSDWKFSNKKESATMQAFLNIALEPLGTTMYVWGGGWNEEDTGLGASSERIGISPAWETFAKQQTSDYDFEDYRFEREKGLDCSGYIGWIVYNLFETEDNQEGYVVKSTEMAENFAYRGWGTLIQNPKEFLVGDIVSMEGHVWICLGTCKDGSVLLIHSSPPGVSVCGTSLVEQKPFQDDNQNDTADTNQSQNASQSQAVLLATKFMTMYYPNWQEKYPNREVPSSYLKEVSVMRWNHHTLSDAEEYQKLSAEEVITQLEK